MKFNLLKRSVALYVATVLILLSGVCLSDEFEYLQKPSETAIHHYLFTPVDEDPYISDEFPGVPQSTEFIGTPAVAHHFMQESTYSILRVSIPPAPSSGNKLFQLLSTYLI